MNVEEGESGLYEYQKLELGDDKEMDRSPRNRYDIAPPSSIQT